MVKMIGINQLSSENWLKKRGIKDHVAINDKAYVNLMPRNFISNVQWHKDAQQILSK